MVGSRGETCPGQRCGMRGRCGPASGAARAGDADDGPDSALGDRLRRGGVCCAAGWRDLPVISCARTAGGFDIPLAWLNAASMVPLLAVAWVAYRDLHVIRAGAADPPSRRLA